jgi:hypothetical protein
VDHSNIIEIQPKWERSKPVKPLTPYLWAEFQECSVLLLVSLFVRAAIPIFRIRITINLQRGVGESVEFVVSHDAVSGARIDHGFDGLEDFNLLWATIDQVANEDGRVSLLAKYPINYFVSKVPKEALQLLEVSVNVSNDVVVRHARKCVRYILINANTSDSLAT